jgi:site-specific recombinase XerD
MPRSEKRKRKYAAGVPHLVRQRGKRRYWTAWIAGAEVSLGTSDAVQATKRLNDLAAERARAEEHAPAEEETTLAALCAQYIAWVQPPRRSPRTAEAIEARLAKFVEFAEAAGVSTCSDVSLKLVQRYIDARVADGVCARTANRDVTPIAGLLRFGKKQEVVAINPLVGDAYRELRLPEPKPLPNGRTISPAQVDAFIKRAYETLHAAYASLFEIIAGTGLRLDEAIHLDASNIDHARKLVQVTPKTGWNTKNYRAREVPASEATLKAARNFIRLRSQVSLERKAVWNQLQRARKLAGLTEFSPHDLRRAWASAMHYRGAPLKSVSMWLGHGSVAVTERYVRVIDTDGHRFLPR